jgi:hypothetical protein
MSSSAGGRAAHLGLNVQKYLVEPLRVQAAQAAGEGGLRGRGEIAVGVGANAQRAALVLGEAAGQFDEVFLAAGRVAQQGQEQERDQRPERIGFHAGAVFGQGLEVLGEGADFGDLEITAGAGLTLDVSEGRLEVFGLQRAASVLDQRAHEEALGLIMGHIVIALVAAPAVGGTQFGPTAGGVDGAAKLRGIDEGLDHEDRMAVAGLPVGGESLERQGEHAGSEIGNGVLGQDQETAIVDDEGAAAITLGAGPTDPGVAVLEVFGGGAEEEDGDPLALGVHGGVMQLLAHGLEPAQVVMAAQQRLEAAAVCGVGEQDEANFLQERLLGGRG